MKKQFKFILLLSLNLFWGCYGCKSDEQKQQAEVAKMEIDSILTISDKDTTSVAKVIAKDEKVKELAKKDIERINKEIEKSEFKDTPCSEIFEDYKNAINQYCKGSITYEQLKKKSKLLDDAKVRMCLNNKYEVEMSRLEDQLEQCLEKQEN